MLYVFICIIVYSSHDKKHISSVYINICKIEHSVYQFMSYQVHCVHFFSDIIYDSTLLWMHYN